VNTNFHFVQFDKWEHDRFQKEERNPGKCLQVFTTKIYGYIYTVCVYRTNKILILVYHIYIYIYISPYSLIQIIVVDLHLL
jgi:hypothetical protein